MTFLQRRLNVDATSYSADMTFIQRHLNVAATSWRWNDVVYYGKFEHSVLIFKSKGPVIQPY